MTEIRKKKKRGSRYIIQFSCQCGVMLNAEHFAVRELMDVRLTLYGDAPRGRVSCDVSQGSRKAETITTLAALKRWLLDHMKEIK